MLQVIHQADFTYNDLKLDNLLFGYNDVLSTTYTDGSCFEGFSVHLVDFGFSTRYIDKATS